MARGQVFTLANQTGNLIETSNRDEANAVAVLNPNDGVVYLKLNGAAGPTPSQWDWKLPSQSYGLFPGPWVSLGLYYLDQSGSGRSGELNVYDSQDKMYTPYIIAIGRAVQAAGTTVDISQGSQPQNPPVSTGRLWIDGNGDLHILSSSGVDNIVYDSSNIGTVSLGGDLYGTIGTAHIGVRYGNTINAYKADSVTSFAMLQIDSANNLLQHTGGGSFYWQDQPPTKNLMFLDMSGNLTVGASMNALNVTARAGYLHTTDGSNGAVYADNGNLYLRSLAGGVVIDSGGGGAGSLQVASVGSFGGALTVTGNIAIANASALYWPNSGNQQLYPTGSGLQLNTFLNTSGDVNANGRLYSPNYLVTPTVYFNSSAAAPYIQNAGAAIRYWASGVHSFEGSGAGGLGSVQALVYTATSGTYYFVNTTVAITWNGTYLNHSHSIQFNTTGNQILWPNGSFISGNAGYVQGSQRALKHSVTLIADSELLAQVSDPRLHVTSYYWEGETKPNTGFIADEIAQVLPKNVVRNENGEPNGYIPQEMIAILWGAVRELSKKVG